MAKKKDTGFDDMFSDAAAPEKKKSKNGDIPEIKLSAEVEKNLVAFLAQKKAMKAAETSMRAEEKPILVEAMTKLETDALAGNYSSSYVIRVMVNKEEQLIKLVTSDKFTFPADPEVIVELEKILGEEFEKVTTEVKGLDVKPELFTDKKLQKKLMDLLKNDFFTFFTPTKKRILNKGFAEKMYKIAKTAEKLAEIKELVPQAKPALK